MQKRPWREYSPCEHGVQMKGGAVKRKKDKKSKHQSVPFAVYRGAVLALLVLAFLMWQWGGAVPSASAKMRTQPPSCAITAQIPGSQAPTAYTCVVRLTTMAEPGLPQTVSYALTNPYGTTSSLAVSVEPENPEDWFYGSPITTTWIPSTTEINEQAVVTFSCNANHFQGGDQIVRKATATFTAQGEANVSQSVHFQVVCQVAAPS